MLESPVPEQAICSELDFARDAFSPWLRRLSTDIDAVLNFTVPQFRKTQVSSFLRLLEATKTRLDDFEAVVGQLPSGGPYKPGDAFLSAHDLLQRLSEAEKSSLRDHLADRVRHIASDFPDLTEQFKKQFSQRSR